MKAMLSRVNIKFDKMNNSIQGYRKEIDQKIDIINRYE